MSNMFDERKSRIDLLEDKVNSLESVIKILFEMSVLQHKLIRSIERKYDSDETIRDIQHRIRQSIKDFDNCVLPNSLDEDVENIDKDAEMQKIREIENTLEQLNPSDDAVNLFRKTLRDRKRKLGLDD